MNEFETTLLKFAEESAQIQQEEAALGAKAAAFNQKLASWLRENGLPDNFTLPAALALAIRKSRA